MHIIDFMKFNRYLVTSALPYANGPLHIGHLAGCYLPSDIYVRYLRLQQRDVIYICGTDEHGVPISIRALQENISPKEVVDKYHKVIGDSLSKMGVSFDIFSRTSNTVHYDTAQEFFLKLYKKGAFVEQESEQFFDTEKEMFLADRYILGTCPVCGNHEAYGDQCEKCGSTLSPDQLINPRSTLSNAPLIKKRTKHWFFPLNKYQEWLKKWIISENQDRWKINVFSQCKSWLDMGLQPRAMTRDSSWGIPVPLPEASGKVLYVWFDAPIGYISATKELTENWADYWQQEDTKLIHFIGKDNIVFHCIIFPAMLKEHGDFVLPDNVPANEFLNIEGRKVSTSKNWAVWINEYLENFPGDEDVLRFVLCSNGPETKDTDFTWKEFQERNNSELVSIFGNFINRVNVLVQKLCSGIVPKYHSEIHEASDQELLNDIEGGHQSIESALENYRFRAALFDIIDLSRKGNKYLQEKAPWTLGKTEELKIQNQKRIDNCLYNCIQLVGNLAIIAQPFLPFTAKKISKMVGLLESDYVWENGKNHSFIPTGSSVNVIGLLFRKIEDFEIDREVGKLKQS